jgi:ABC-type lipoprotein export system ATPase subunit
MKLVSISIEKLFGQFDYNIEFNQEEGITILTGPNGYGKTTILNIIAGLFTYGDPSYIVNRPIPLSNVSVSLSDGRILKFPENQNDIKNLIRVYLIKDQRLIKEIFPTDEHFSLERKPVNVNTVNIFSFDLRHKISEKQDEEKKLDNELAPSLTKRFKEYKTILPASEYRERFQKVSEKYKKLHEYGIYQNDLESTAYEGDDRRFFSLNLEDWEKKIAVYDKLLDKIALFLSIMNSKCLANKNFTVSAKEGFCFTSIDNKPLQLTDLSSGEQHQTILLYELLFNAPPNSLVLIDEPEASMHVAWQIEFLRDIEKIAKLSGLSFIIATHSPDLINDKIDLCVDLFENAQGEKQHG